VPEDGRSDIDHPTGEGRDWLDRSLALVAADPGAILAAFPAAARRCGRAAADEARAALLLALPLRGAPLAGQVAVLHRRGDPAEQRAVLLALPRLDLGDLALPLVREALRGNDTTLLEAAVGPYAARHLDPAEFRHAVLKCVFCEIPLAAVAGLAERADGELARMLADLAHERVAAGREVPADVWPVLAAFPDALAGSGLPAEAASPSPPRRAAAERALESFRRAAGVS